MKKLLLTIPAALLVAACCPSSFETSEEYPPIRPDYIGVTIPEGIADLHFEMQDGRCFRESREQRGDTLFVTVSAWEKGARSGVSYKPFPIYVSKDPIDPYIAYRLIEPNYESWRDMGIYTRELASFKERALVTNRATGGGCVNCHNFPGGNPSRMMFHARGKGGGTVFIDEGKARILNLATVGPKRQGTYPAWHPSGRYIAYSSNTTRQVFPIIGTQPVEVYDTASDIIIYDTTNDSIRVVSGLVGDEALETFPAWSPDGKTLFYCSAPGASDVVGERAGIRYALKAVDFDEGLFVGKPRTIWSSDTLSASFPRVYGEWLLFTASAFGTFPIWHKEAELMLMNLVTGEVQPAATLNSDDTESYHSWSSNGKWVVFSSRRLGGRYTRLFIAHFDGEGNFDKPFLLPQKKMSYNDLRLKSYNIPEFVQGDPGCYESKVKKLFGR